jgi:GTP-binding protein
MQHRSPGTLFLTPPPPALCLIPQGSTRICFKIATRGLLGLKNALLTATRGTGIMNTLFDKYQPVAGEISMRDLGSLVAFETGQVTSYALESAQERGTMFVKPGEWARGATSV